ncbi:hypothetical protein QR680_008888 [Steinernema hermaphroditum]|uniref:Uncharacterized protein n=1 Tax=Steinernema hermaphroditum TaxID=289476 RepID=A0AA39M8W4_9BILA|nr:hypothetical protein QR680_008888 [Steinernema hermaphroditum]
MDIRGVWLEAILNVIALILSSLALSSYFFRRHQSQPYGMLTTQIVTFVVYGLVNVPYSICQLLGQRGYGIWSVFGSGTVLPPPFDLYGAFVTAVILSNNFVYVSGALLALDRVLLMTFPLRYNRWRMNFKLPALAIAIFLLTDAISVVCIAVLPFFPANPRTDLSATFVVDQIYKVYAVLFILETVLHVWFCVKFWRYSKRQGKCQKKRHLLKANHIALFQIVSQSLLCMIPNTIRFVNMQFFGDRIPWMMEVGRYYGLLFTTNIVLSASFVVYKMWTQRRSSKVGSMVVTTQNSRNSQ